MKNIVNILLVITILSSMISCGSKEETKATESIAIDVTVEKFQASNINESYQYSGKVISDKQTVLSTKLFGQVQNILVKEGDKITKGQLLVQIKSKDVESKLAAAQAGKKEAKAAQTNAQKNFDRIKNLFEKGSATQRELDDITAQRNMANARVESVDQNIEELKELLTYANLKSPINGFVSKKYVNQGDMASPGHPILALESLEMLKIDLNVPEFEIALFKEGEQVSVGFNSLSSDYDAVVARVIPSTASGTQFKVSVILTNPSKQIKPGMIGKVQLYKQATKKLIINQDYLIRKGQLQGVFIVNQQGQAMLRWLRLGETHGSGYEVLSGLDEGEMIISSSSAKLINGQKVSIKNI